MDQKVLQAIMQFMQRVQLQGAEVPTFSMCMYELQKLAQQSIQEVPKEPELQKKEGLQ